MTTDPSEPITVRPNARPFRFNPIAGPDEQRIYVLNSKTFEVATKNCEPGVVAELRTHRGYSLTRILGSCWMFVTCLLIAWLASHFGRRQLFWALTGIGCLASMTFGAVMLFDFLQSLRLPRTLVSVRGDGTVEFFGGERILKDYQSIKIKTNRISPKHPRMFAGNTSYTLDLEALVDGQVYSYHLAAALNTDLLPVARRLATATGMSVDVGESLEIPETDD